MPMVHQLGDREQIDADKAVPPTVADLAGAKQDAPARGWLDELAEARKRLMAQRLELVIELPGRWPKADGSEGFGTMVARVRPLTPEQDERLGKVMEGIPDEDGSLALLATAIAATELDGRPVDSGPRGGIGVGIATLLGIDPDTAPHDLLRVALDDNPTATKLLGVRVIKWLSNPRPADDTAGGDPFAGLSAGPQARS